MLEVTPPTKEVWYVKVRCLCFMAKLTTICKYKQGHHRALGMSEKNGGKFLDYWKRLSPPGKSVRTSVEIYLTKVKL